MTFQITKEVYRFIKENYDSCSVCNRNFVADEKVTIGYSNKSELLSVGSCCESLVKQKHLGRIYGERLYKIPKEDDTIWKFIDLPKFVSMLMTKSIFFARADKFSDPFEGAKGTLKNKDKWDNHHLDFLVKVSKSLSKIERTEQEINDEAKRNLENWEIHGIENKSKTGVSCWHENPFESEAMWKLYTSLEYGIAIKSSYKRLYDALGADPNIDIGRINYINFEETFSHLYNPFWFKRKSFSHENEVRAIIRQSDPIDGFGKSIPVDLEILIDTIYVSPTAQSWYGELVIDIMTKYNLNKPISESSLNEKPFF